MLSMEGGIMILFRIGRLLKTAVPPKYHKDPVCQALRYILSRLFSF